VKWSVIDAGTIAQMTLKRFTKSCSDRLRDQGNSSLGCKNLELMHISLTPADALLNKNPLSTLCFSNVSFNDNYFKIAF